MSPQPESKTQKITRLTEELLFAQDVIDTIREAFVVLDFNLRIITANPSFYAFFKVKKEDTEGKLLYDIGNKQWDIAELRTLLEKIIPTHSIFNDYEVNHDFPGIGRKVMFLNARRIDHKKLILLAFEDVTQRRNAENYNQDFIAMASHELKTPITSAKMFTQVLHRRFEKLNDKESQRLLKKMDKNLEKLNELVKDILDVTKVQQGKLAVQKEKFLIKNLVQDIVEDLQPITKHQLVLDWHTQLYVLGDKERIRQILVNLITNAIKYSPQADRVIISSRNRSNSIRILVQDFGTGIPKAEQKKIFERFYQANQHKTYPGLGLGLYISSEIIKAHGGEIGVKSKPGEGSTFYFTLPTVAKVQSKKNKPTAKEIQHK